MKQGIFNKLFFNYHLMVCSFYRKEREQRIGEMQEKREKLRQQLARDKVSTLYF